MTLPNDRPVRVVLLYSTLDTSLAHELEKMLGVLVRSRKSPQLELWSPRQIRAGEDFSETFARQIERADVVLLAVSENFLAEHYDWVEAALAQRARRGALVIPVRLRPVLLNDTPLEELAPLPRNGIPITRWPNPDDAYLDVVQGLDAVLDYSPPTPQTIHAPFVPSTNEVFTPSMVQQEAQVQAPAQVETIFRTDGAPDVTFVEPAQFDDIQHELGAMGRTLVVEGPSKVGKSTAVRKVIAQQGAQVEWFDGKKMSSFDPDKNVVDRFRAAIDRISAETFSGHLVIDDFHYVDDELKRRLALRAKGLADLEERKAKVTVIGINPVGESLIKFVPDLVGRQWTVRMHRQPDAKLAELIARGEEAAGVLFRERASIINQADGSFYIVQLLCAQILRKAGVKVAQAKVLPIDLGPAEILPQVRQNLRAAYHDRIRDFAAHDEKPPPRGAGLALLWLLASGADGNISLQEAIYRYPPLREALEWLRASNLQRFFETHPTIQELLYYNKPAGTLAIEDPQLKFFLRNVDWEELARASGHTNVQFHRTDGPQFSSPHVDPTPKPAAVSGGVAVVEPVAPPVSALAVLHLSDLHIREESQASIWYAQLAADLRLQGCEKLHAVVVSGDVTNLAVPAEFNAARLFLEQILGGFGLAPRDLVIVPGNHDLNWLTSQDAYALHKRARYSGRLIEGTFIEHSPEVIEVRDDAAYKRRFENFAAFYRTIRGEDYPLEYDQQGLIYALPARGLTFLGLNSAWQLDHHFRSRAGIHPGALANALLRLGPVAGTRIAVFHHPVHSDAADRITDAAFLQQLAGAGFRLALHGHIHKSQNQLYRYDMTPGGRRIDLVGAGTFGAPTHEWVPGYPLQYNLLRIATDKVFVETRRKEEIHGAWAPDARWHMGPNQVSPSYEIELK